MAAARIGFSCPANCGLGLKRSGHLLLLRESSLCIVSCGFRLQRSASSKPTQFAQPGSSRPNSIYPQREGTNLGEFGPVWLVLPRCDATNLGVFDLCHFDLLKRGCANSGGFGFR